MSDTPPPILPPVPSPEQARSGCLTALMVVFGIIMLLPGLCALLFGGGSLIGDGRIESDVVPLVIFGLLVGFAGIMLIRAAIKGSGS